MFPQVPLGEFYKRHSALLGGQANVGRKVCVDWGLHNAAQDPTKYPYGWYAGKLEAYDEDTGEYEVSVPAAETDDLTVQGQGHVV